jgi:hypothetical protein
MAIYLSEVGGGGGDFELDTFPVAASSIVLSRNQQYAFQAYFWNTIFGSGGAGIAYVAKPSSGWHTVVNFSGKGLLHQVVSPAFGALNVNVIVRITVDGVVKDFNYTMASTYNWGLPRRVRFICGFSGGPMNGQTEALYNEWNNSVNVTASVVDYSPTLIDSQGNGIFCYHSPDVFRRFAIPSLPFSSSLNVQVYTSSHITDEYANYASAVYSILP